jgi:DNA mismatch repair protein MutL
MRILRLEPDVAARIAAGEVVERPVSVVKELLENALDAGARSVAIAFEGGGKERILIEDDGAGIAFDDLALALERHATSKIVSPEDLLRVRTLGFRGEALASVAAVSRLEIRSRPRGEEGGAIRAEGGLTGDPLRIPCVLGTRIQVEDLFFNLPARRRFLKSASAEGRRILQVVRDYALVCPGTAFSLTGEGRTLLSLSPAE